MRRVGHERNRRVALGALLALVVLGGGTPVLAADGTSIRTVAEPEDAELRSPDAAASPTASRWRWRHTLSLGLDTFIHTYPLAFEDTTETVTEGNVGYVVEGRSPRSGRHRWSVRANLLAGTELFRQRLETQYAWLPDERRERLRIDVDLAGRQYNRSTDYSLSSDQFEACGEIRGVPIQADHWEAELRIGGDWNDFRTPSSLEQDYREIEAAAFLSAPAAAATHWSVGVRRSARAYPDTAAIDRDVWAVEGEFALAGGALGDLRAFHRSARRDIADTTVRPSTWLHWSDLRAELLVGPGEVIVEAESEVWRYGYETTVYFDSWRGRGYAGYRLGDLLTVAWQLGLAGERFDAGSQPETYDQYGVRAGLESYGGAVSGSCAVEYGRRRYRAPASVAAISTDNTVDDDALFAYTDFHYWELWLTATWRLSASFAIEALASYRPERHTESLDDTALGFGSLRLVWRP